MHSQLGSTQYTFVSHETNQLKVMYTGKKVESKIPISLSVTFLCSFFMFPGERKCGRWCYIIMSVCRAHALSLNKVFVSFLPCILCLTILYNLFHLTRQEKNGLFLSPQLYTAIKTTHPVILYLCMSHQKKKANGTP